MLDFYHAKDGIDTLYWTDVLDDKIFKGTMISGCMLRIQITNKVPIININL